MFVREIMLYNAKMFVTENQQESYKIMPTKQGYKERVC